ncbi:MAG: hypothetical protein AAGK09_08670 [Planctomycetota bacterium]
MPESPESFACPSCAKRYRWTSAMAGKKVACKECGEKLRVPAQAGEMAEVVGAVKAVEPRLEPEPASDDGGYELADSGAPVAAAPTLAAPQRNGKCPACNQPMKPGAVLCLGCGFSLETGSKLNTAVGGDAPGSAPEAKSKAERKRQAAAADATSRAVFDGRSRIDDDALDADLELANRWKYTYTPIILVAFGVLLTLFNSTVLAYLAVDSNAILNAYGGATSVDVVQRMLVVFVYSLIRVAVQVPLTLAALFIVANLFGTSFGTLGSAMLRLLAVVLIAGGTDDTTWLALDILTGGFAGIGFLFQLVVSVTIFFIIAMWQLETDVMETGVLWFLTIFAPSFIMGFVGVIILGLIFG